MANILENQLFLQYLSEAGSAMSQGQPVAPALNKVNQQQISSRSFMKMMQPLLKQGGKVNMDRDNINIKAPIGMFEEKDIPQSQLGDMSGGTGQPDTNLSGAVSGSQLPGGSGIDWTNPANTKGLGVLNPFAASPAGASNADLAGLTPEMISQAFQFKLKQEGMEQQKVRDVIDRIYKGSLIRQGERRTETEEVRAGTARLAEWRKIAEIPEKIGVKVGDQVLDVEPHQALDYYAKKYDLPTSYETYKIAREDPEFMDYLKETKGGVIIDIGDRVELAERTKRATDTVARESKVKAPDFHQGVKEDLMKDKKKWRSSGEAERISKKYNIPYAKAKVEAQMQMHLKAMDSEIKSVFGDDVEFVFEKGWVLNGEVIVRNPYAK